MQLCTSFSLTLFEATLKFLFARLKLNVLRTFKLFEVIDQHRNALLDAVDRKERTPLHTAAKLGDAMIVEMLLASGSNVSSRSSDGKTPLHYSVRFLPIQFRVILIDLCKQSECPRMYLSKAELC